jgi:hypothetical protein
LLERFPIPLWRFIDPAHPTSPVNLQIQIVTIAKQLEQSEQPAQPAAPGPKEPKKKMSNCARPPTR